MKKIIIIIFGVLLFWCQTCFANVCDNLYQYTLANGQKVIIKEVENNPIVIIDTFIKTGSINENEKNNGVAHFLEHLFFKGTHNHKRGYFEKEIEKRGGVFNAATSRDYTHYYVKIDNKHFDKALELHADMLLNIAIPENELATERKVVLEEITRSNDNPSSKVFDNFMNIVFDGNPYQRKILGTNEIISTISRDEIFEFYNTWYQPSNMVTVIVGDVNAQDILPKIANAFKKTTLSTPEFSSNTSKIALNNTKKIIKNSNIDSGYMVLGYKTIGVENLKEAYALNIAATLLANGQNSILYKELKEKDNLILDIGAGNYSLKNSGIFYISTIFKPENYKILLSKLQTELEKFPNSLINSERVELIKNATKRDFEYSNENIASIANMLGYDVAIGNGLNDYCNYINTIDEITPEFIQETVKKYLKKENLIISVLLPENQSKDKQNNIKKVSNIKKQNAKLISKYKNIQKYLLPNGATLILEPNTANNVIATKIFIKGGSLAEDKSGTSIILSDSILKGTKTKSGKEIENILDKIGTNLSIADEFEYFEVSMKTTKNDFTEAFLILKEILENPIFPENEITLSKQDQINLIKTARDNPQNLAFENFYEILYQNSPFLKTGRILENSIPQISREDVVSLHNKVFNPNNMIISVAGNFDTQDVINKFSSFKNNQNPQIDNKILQAQFEKKQENITKTEGKNSKGAWIIQGWPTEGFKTQDFVALKLISNYLGAGFSSQLFVNLRENKGLAYEVGANSSSKFNSGLFFMYIGTNPENITEVLNDFQNEINKLKTTFIPTESLCNLKQMMIGRLKLANETNMSKAYMNGYYELFDKGYKFGYDYPQLIEKISAQDILEVANKYFSQPYILSIVAEDKYIKK